MHKKLFKLTIAVASLLCINTVSAAVDHAHHAVRAPVLSANRFIKFLNSHFDHVVLNITTDYEYFHLPKFTMGSHYLADNRYVVAAKSNQAVLIPHLQLDYYWHPNIITTIDFSAASGSHRQFNATLPNGTLWKIDGSGDVMDAPGKIVITQLRNFRFHSAINYDNLGFYVRYRHLSTWQPAMMATPYLGIIITRLSQTNQSSTTFNMGEKKQPIWAVDSVDESMDSYYFGAAIGNRLSYRFTNHLAAFAELQCQLLKAVSYLDAKQTPNDKAPRRIEVKDSEHVMASRVLLSSGLTFHFKTTAMSPALRLVVGLDRWDHIPVVHNPGGYNKTQLLHLEDQSMLNTFVGVNFQWPLI